ncbi:hypothetical protein CO174_02900 [Candidatus Uhrbacteria bacterium CG_4_9_14_3_um_filter_50_9]|uniref:Anti-sigma factor n=1 Tax=Candidatus Uhrbacteria bacterium CG_4_9_14_3_um_filter_50_9 TaxID=1975035 RepID=A0A2M7XC82_9BACT|nr:MAG: hypothetical protein CO174_02900 [Candidatus Uhrbacteria bacterium CG_4_9_14_3_um_filter_50_9]
MKKHFLLLSAILFVGTGCFGGGGVTETEDPVNLIDHDAILLEAKENGLIMDDEEINSMRERLASDVGLLQISDVATLADSELSESDTAALADVTGGESFGLAHAAYENGVYTMVARMGGLPEPAEGYFYEGWIVRRGEDLSVISTGPVTYLDNDVVNVYRSTTDLTDHNFFVLTLEADDGNPSPLEHILEGTFK